MIVQSTFQNRFSLLSAIIIIACLSSTSFGQEIVSGTGDRLIIGEGTDQSIDNPFSDAPVLTLTPTAGVSEIANATIIQGTRTTICSAKKIVYTQNKGNFQLEGNAKIQIDKNMIVGPEKIEYDSENGFLTALGSEKALATFTYIINGQQSSSSAVKLIFHFDEKGELINFKTEKNKQSIHIIEVKSSKKAGTLNPKLSNQ